jgi:glucose-1-phosphate cytidylyltransferase
MQVVILCGGKGRRMGKDLEGLPKALLPVGKKPILWHIMKYYAAFGHNDFLLCLGYRAEEIIKYFRATKEFKIQFAHTGLDTNTGGRIKRVERLIRGDSFFATYGDGLSDINLHSLLRFHCQQGKPATLTAVRPKSSFGIVGIDAHTNSVTHFEEKPILDHWINGGFFVFRKEIFAYLKDNDVLERHSFGRLLKVKGISAFKHKGFWKCMDTYKDNLELNEIWNRGKAAWKKW